MASAKIALGRVQTGTFQGDLMQAQARAAAAKVNTLPFTKGWVIVTGVVFAAATARDVTHNLGTTDIGYFVVRSYGTNVSNIIGESGTASDPDNATRLITTLAGTRDILFFKY